MNRKIYFWFVFLILFQYLFQFESHTPFWGPCAFLLFLLPCQVIARGFFAKELDCFEDLDFLSRVLIEATLGVSVVSIFFNIYGHLGGIFAPVQIFFIFTSLYLFSYNSFMNPNRKDPLLEVKYDHKIFLSLPIIIFLVLAALMILRTNSGHWDHFTFWWINPKEIYVNKHFLFSTEPFPVHILYSSFYTLPLTLFYNFFGHIVEQYTLFFTIFYLATGIFLVLNYFRNTKVAHYLLVISYLSIYIYSRQEYLHSYYAEFYVTSLISIIAYLLFATEKINISLVFYLLFILSFIKSTNKIYALVLFVFIAAFILNQIRTGKISWRSLGFPNLILILPVLLFIVSREYYLTALFRHRVDFLDFLDFSTIRIELTIQAIAARIWELSCFLFSYYYFLLPLICLVLLLTFLGIIRKSENFYWILLLIFLLPALNFFHYLISDYSLLSKSLARYVSTTMLLVPFLIHPVQSRNRILMTFFVIVTYSLSCYLLFMCYSAIFSENQTRVYNQGVYKNPSKRLARRIEPFLDRGERIAIYESRQQVFINGGNFGNNLHYELVDYDVDKGIANVNSQNFIKRIQETKPEKIIVLNCNDFAQDFLLKHGFIQLQKVGDHFLYRTKYDN